MLRLILLAIVLCFSIEAAQPVISLPICDAPPDTPSTLAAYNIRCTWITDITSSSVIKYSTTPGVYSTVVDRGLYGTIHSVIAGGDITPSTTYYVIACSTDTLERCTSEQTVTTAAAPASNDPSPPVAVDTAWTAGTNPTPLTVGSDCLHPTTGLQRLINDAVLGDKIILPTTTVNCSVMLTLPDKGAGTDGILITTDATARPPTGVRDGNEARWGRSTIYKSRLNIGGRSAPDMAAATGKVYLSSAAPGTILFEYNTPTFNVKKAALTGVAFNISNATNATPIVITLTPGHGFVNGDTVCVQNVLGNLAANGCFVAALVTFNTIALTLRSGANQVGSGTYTSGGTAQGLIWTAQTLTYTQGSRLSGACAISGIWGVNTAETYFSDGLYMCGTDLLWYQIWNSDNNPTDSNGDNSNAVFMALPGAHHYRIEGINFADLPVPLPIEMSLGPRNDSDPTGVNGGSLSGIFQGGKDSHHISFRQISAPTDLSKWRTNILFSGLTTDFELANSYLSCGGYKLAFIPDAEMACSGVSMTNSIGPILVHNNYFKVGGWAYFAQEPDTLAVHKNITFTKNVVVGVLDFAYGTIYYTQSNLKAMLTRQLFELKTGSKVLIEGNTFDGQITGYSPIGSAIAIGTQVGWTYPTTINAAGVVNINSIRQWPLSLGVNQKLLFFNGTITVILRVAAINSNIITVKNLDGTPYSYGDQTASFGYLAALDTTIQTQDIDIKSNTFVRVPVSWNAFGNSYSFGSYEQPASADRFRVQNNLSELISLNIIGSWHYNSPTSNPVSSHWVAGYVDHVNINHNTSRMLSGSEPTNFIVGMESDGTVYQKNTGMTSRDNIIVSQGYGILGVSPYTGSSWLNFRWPNGWTWAYNAYLRTGGAISGEPSGNTYPTEADMLWANASGGNYQFLASSPYRTNTSDGYPMGHDIRILNAAQGKVANQRATGGTGTLDVFWSYAGGAACTVDASNDSFATYTRGTSATTAYVQTVQLSLAAGTWSYQVLCPGTVDPVVTSVATVN